LQAFLAIAETGSFSLAAQRLHLTQPAVSKRIAILEEQLNTSLFDRIGRQVSLTQAGLLLLPTARTILQEVAAAQRAIADLNGYVSGQMSSATAHRIGWHRLPPYLRDLSRSLPEAILVLRFLDSEEVFHSLLQGRFALAVDTFTDEVDSRIAAAIMWRDQ